jgi:acyl-coenzyme A thioesterase PaaI-like protein
MSLAAYCVKKEDGTTPYIEMQVSFHRPVRPGEDVKVHVRVLSATKSLIRLSSQLHQYDKLCVSATGTYFQKS